MNFLKFSNKGIFALYVLLGLASLVVLNFWIAQKSNGNFSIQDRADKSTSTIDWSFLGSAPKPPNEQKVQIATSTNIITPPKGIMCNDRIWSPCVVGKFVCPLSGNAFCQKNEPSLSMQNTDNADINAQITSDKQKKLLLAVTEWLISEQDYNKKEQQYNDIKAAYYQCNEKFDEQIKPLRTRYFELTAEYNQKMKFLSSTSLPAGAIQKQLNDFISTDGKIIQDEMSRLSATLTGLTENKNSECDIYYTLLTGQPVLESKPYSPSINSYLESSVAPKAQDLNCRVIQHYDNLAGTQYEVRCDNLDCITKNGSGGTYSADCN